ncbi:MAG: biopolymer transporter TolR [Flammeovirgaceae bacterium]|nr:biopolymer transporter TolR [Flammeovirgaceae bacterium]
MKSITFFMIILITMSNPSFSQSKLGIFDNHTDIGNCKNKGFASFNAQEQTYTIGGSGFNMWFGEDEFHYLWTTLQGDFILRTEAKFLGAGVDPHRKFGWIVKNNLAHNSHHVNATVHGDGLTSLQYRKSIGGETEQVVSTDSFPDVIQLERIGDTFYMSTAKFGEEFTTVKLESMNLDDEVYVGIYVCSHNPEITETAVFRNVRIIRPADSDFQPYRDYIGSHMEVMDIQSGHRKVLFSSAHSIQAPNWTVDGQNLIYNSKGHLYNYQFDTQNISLLNTGFANKNNNDHVLSFDGKTIGISHHNPDDDTNSTIYYLPTEGDSLPKVVTKPGVGDSYFHGWSPDGQKMVFTGHRKGQYDIYLVDKDTGKETQLTDKKTLDDGPEYSPDGKQIFFNSVRTGKMKLWKMEADGKNQTQLTFDEYNDWFPHISPDQKWIVFISFPKDIDPNDHPFYKHCLLRIMPYEGGKPRILGYLYGGQGTINVPSWSPDSQRIAFVTNTKL